MGMNKSELISTNGMVNENKYINAYPSKFTKSEIPIFLRDKPERINAFEIIKKQIFSIHKQRKKQSVSIIFY